MKAKPITRRSAVCRITGSAAALAAVTVGRGIDVAEAAVPSHLKNRINHSVCKWCYGKIPLDEFCKSSREIGLASVELLQPSDFPTLRKYDLTCAMVSNPVIDGLGRIEKAWNRIEHHDKLVQAYEQQIKAVADAGMERLICFSGNREGLDDEKGMENCAQGLKRIMKLAEEKKITICMELLNSRVNHKDYQCDHTEWGVELCKKVSSERFKLLYDIYHMQIMKGDLIARIRKYHSYIAHYHTGGVPGRGEIDETQEINYPAVIKAIIETGFKGFVAQEFVPKRPDQIASLKQGVEICDV
ncbi:MAG TPA: TIM barrel protein [Candidatus Binatia bacterium]|nr:TIM barrel protein [Candidatus Binatia bacterium]